MQNKYEQFIEAGFKRAEDSRGRPSLLTSYLTPLVAEVVKNINDKSEAQQTLIDKHKGEARVLESNINEVQKQIDNNDSSRNLKREEQTTVENERKQKISRISDRIKEKQKSIDDLATKVGKVETGENKGKRTNYGFYIGAPILIFLTFFLWIFYCSAMHSALIRDVQSDLRKMYEAKTYESEDFGETTFDEINTVASIINLNAVDDAWNQGGFFGIFLVLFAVGFPLGAGFLLYVFKGTPWKVVAVYIGTFIFDVVLAYHIVKDIYIAKHDTGVPTYEQPWDASMFYQQISFYMILMIGFVGYIMWGLILDYLLSEKDKFEPLKNEITGRQTEIEQLKEDVEKVESNFDNKSNQLVREIRQIDDDNRKLQREITDLGRQINAKNQEAELIKSKIPIPKADLESTIESFFAGWCTWIVNHLNTRDVSIEEKAIKECEDVKKRFLEEVYNSKEYFIIKE